MALASDSMINELQQVQLRAQILVYGHLLQGTVPEEPLMVGAFSDTSNGLEESYWNDGRHIWEKAWLVASTKAQETPGDDADPDSSQGISQSTPRLVGTMPTATRSSLTALHPAAKVLGSDPDESQDSRRRKKSNQSELDEDDGAPELEIGQVKQNLEDAEAIVASILEHKKALYPLLQSQMNDHGQLASVTIAFEAAASAASAAAAAAAVAYKAASQAASIYSTGEICEQEVHHQNYEAVSCIVHKAVSQAQSAMAISTSSDAREINQRHQRGGQLDASVLTEGVTVEVISGHPEGWLTAKILSVKDGMVRVSYNELMDDSKNHVTEWVQVEPKSYQHPRIRCPYPTFDLNETHDEAPKRWTGGDHIDVRVGHAWRQGVVVWALDDEVTVYYLHEGGIENVKSCDVRPSLLWQGNKWTIEKSLSVDQVEKEETLKVDVDAGAEHGETGPSPNHKMRKLIDVILEESEAQKRRDENPRLKRQKKSAETKKHSKVTSKVNKAKKLIEKASKPNLQASGSRLNRQSTSTAVNSSKVALAKGHQMLRQIVKLKANPKRSLLKQQQQQTATKGERPPRLIQPKVVDFFGSRAY